MSTRNYAKQECELLNSFNDNYYGYGVAPVDAALGIITLVVAPVAGLEYYGKHI